MRNLFCLLLFPVIIVLSAVSFIQQTTRPSDQLDKLRRRNYFGWLSPQMVEHWNRLFSVPISLWYHSAKNVLAEWVALDPQRAGKLLSFIILVLFTIAALAIFR